MAESLLTGVSGLRVHQELLDVVGNNLANMNTPGFKSQRVRFGDLLYQTLREGTSSASLHNGGTLPLQTGLGAAVLAIDSNLQQGSLEPTGNVLDLAIQGNGYFVVNDGIRNVFTRVGAFGVDQDNYLTDLGTGYRVQRFGNVGEGDGLTPGFQITGDNRIRIPVNTGVPGRATELVTLQGNLSAGMVGPLAEVLTSSLPFTSGGSPATAGTLLNDLDDNTTDYVVGDIIRIQGTDVDGSAVSVNFAVDGTTTLGDLAAAISAAFAGATATVVNGNLVLTADNTGPAALSLTLANDPGNTGSMALNNHAMQLTTNGKHGDTVSGGIQIYDSQGTGHIMSITFRKQTSNVWDLFVSVASGEGTVIDSEVHGIEFNDDGSFRQVTGSGMGDPAVVVQFIGISTPQTIRFSFGMANGFDGLTQFGGPNSAGATKQDGYAAGFLSSLSVAKDGTINGIFSNGQIAPIAQLGIASFQNPAALNRIGNNYYAISTQSGEALIGGGLSGGRGSVEQSVLESSNVDVALEFTRLIIAQRGFQVNARTITASDTILQELAQIVR